MVPDLKGAEHLRTGTDHHVIAQRRMTFAAMFTGTAECHTLINSAVIAHLRRFTDDNGTAVIDENALADFCSRMNLNSCQAARNLADRTGAKKCFFPCR